MVVGYINIALRYYRSNILSGLAYIFCLSVGMGSLLLFITSFIHEPFAAKSLPYLTFALVIFFLYGLSMDQRWYKRGLVELGLRHLFGAGVFEIFVQLLVESIILISLSGIVAMVLLDILISWLPFMGTLSTNMLFNSYSLISYVLSIPAISMLMVLIPTITLANKSPKIRLR